MDFLHQWRHWIRPFIISLYFVLLIIALPLCVVELHQNGAARHVEAWFTGGIFVMMAIPISLWGILQHLVNYTQPNLQRHIIRYTYQAHSHKNINCTANVCNTLFQLCYYYCDDQTIDRTFYYHLDIKMTDVLWFNDRICLLYLQMK